MDGRLQLQQQMMRRGLCVHPGNIHSPTTTPDNELKAQHSHPNHSAIQGERKDDEELESGAKGNNHYYRLLLVLLLLLLLFWSMRQIHTGGGREWKGTIIELHLSDLFPPVLHLRCILRATYLMWSIFAQESVNLSLSLDGSPGENEKRWTLEGRQSMWGWDGV